MRRPGRTVAALTLLFTLGWPALDSTVQSIVLDHSREGTCIVPADLEHLCD